VDLDEVERIEARLHIELGGPSVYRRIRREASRVLRDLERRVVRLADDGAVWPPGAVFCFRCDRFDCEHGVPPSPLEVFLGYDPTGRPRYGEFLGLLLARRADRASELFASKAPVLAVILDAAELRDEQLPVFGRSSRRYDLVGQVCAGYFNGAGPRSAASPKHALSLQVVRTATGEHELRVVGHTPPGTDPTSRLSDDAAEVITDVLRQARRRLGERREADSSPRSGKGRRPAVSPFLSWLARAIEHAFRQRDRRTRHARERADDATRPTQKAREDARQAEMDRVVLDTESGAFVVLGPRGRAHVYSPRGLHVTSLVIPADAARRRIASGRWRPARAREWEAFRSLLASEGTGTEETRHERRSGELW